MPLVLGGRLVNLHIIDRQGNKRFLAGGRVQGCYCPLDKVIAGDDDRLTLGNPGRAAANRAAAVAEALVVFPDCPYDGPAELSDFNDLHLWQSERWEVPA